MVYLQFAGLIFLGLMFFSQLLAASWFDIVKKTGDKKRALKHKVICSLIYISTLLLCMAVGKNSLNVYVILFCAAFAMFFIHDILEETDKITCKFISSLLSFSGYMLLAVAFYLKNAELFGFAPFSTKIRLAIPVAIAVLCIILSTKTKTILPAIASVYMLVNGGLIAFKLQNGEPGLFQAASCAITLGAIALTISSILPVFDKEDKKSLLRINTYYFGLMFISCSVAVL